MPAMAAAAIAFVTAGAAVPTLDSTYTDQVVRARIAESLVALRPLQRQLEAWFISRSPSDAPPLALVSARSGSESPEIVTVSLTNGRVRLALDPLGPELYGAVDPPRPGDRPSIAGALDLHPRRRPREIPAAGVPPGVTVVVGEGSVVQSRSIGHGICTPSAGTGSALAPIHCSTAAAYVAMIWRVC